MRQSLSYFRKECIKNAVYVKQDFNLMSFLYFEQEKGGGPIDLYSSTKLFPDKFINLQDTV